MITKAAFFAILNNPANKIGVTAHIFVSGREGGKTALVINQFEAPNTFISMHRDTANTIQAAFTKYNAWLNEWFQIQIAKMEVEAAHAEALELNESFNEFQPEIDGLTNEQLAMVMHANFFGGLDYAARRDEFEKAHTEALELNEIVDKSVMVATCFADNDNATHNAISRAIDIARSELLAVNRYKTRFIVKMMISVSSLAKEARAKAKLRHLAMLERCATQPFEFNEIPF